MCNQCVTMCLFTHKHRLSVFVCFRKRSVSEQVVKRALVYFRIHTLVFLEYRKIDSALVIVFLGCKNTDALVCSNHPSPQRSRGLPLLVGRGYEPTLAHISDYTCVYI